MPEPCHVYTSITWLTESVAQLNNSHLASEDFYNSVTHCTFEGPNGTNHTVNSKETFDFQFSIGTEGNSTEENL